MDKGNGETESHGVDRKKQKHLSLLGGHTGLCLNDAVKSVFPENGKYIEFFNRFSNFRLSSRL